MRIVRNLLAFLFLLTGAAVVALALAVYLAVTGHNLPMLRSVVGAVGRTVAGQQTTALSLAVRLQPDAQRLSGTAALTVRATAAGRRRLYFLLNDGLSVRAAWQESDGGRTRLPFYRLWLLTVIELPRALAADEEIRIGLDYDGQPRAAGVSISSLVLTADDVVITPADFWYPADLQSFFTADVEVLLPADLTLVHNGREASRSLEGTSARVRFAPERPVAGLGLVAGRYEEHSGEREGVRGRVFLPADIHLDATRLIDAMARSQQSFTTHYGSSGFTQVTMYVSRRLRRAFNDGTGLIGIPPRYFSDGEYGFGLIAHEVAHNWWGATVAEHWLQPGTGGEWIVEGFAQFSGWRAVAEHRGEAALLRVLAREFFDPDQSESLMAMSAIDNALDRKAHATIYSKGSYVTYMLQQRLGEEGFDGAARQFLDQFRHRAATATDVEATFAAAAQQDLAPFFAAWVRGNESIDLALEAEEGGAVVRNLRTAPPPTEAITWWAFRSATEPEKQTAALGAAVPLANAERLVLDPLANVADMLRGKNVLPRHENPRSVARSARGDLMIVSGEPYAWEPATINVSSATGTAHSWVIDRGVMTDPVWSADGTRILAVESARGGQPTLLVLNVTDGSRRSAGHDTIAAATAAATIVARDARLLRIAAGKTTVLAEHPGGRVAAPLVAPNGTAVAYAVVWETTQTMDLRLLPGDGSESRVLFTWPAGRVRWRWSPDGTRLFAALVADWDWQLWELSADGTAPRVLVHEAASIGDPAVAQDGTRIAIVAQAEVDDPTDRAEVFVIDRATAGVRRFDLGGWTAYSVAWVDDQSLVVVVADPTSPSLPVHKQLRTLRLSDGTLAPFP